MTFGNIGRNPPAWLAIGSRTSLTSSSSTDATTSSARELTASMRAEAIRAIDEPMTRVIP